jgi:hypothetical protein
VPLEPLASDRPILQCPVCDMKLSPAQIAGSVGVVRFAVTQGRCPLCTLNAIVRDQPDLRPITPSPEESTDDLPH